MRTWLKVRILTIYERQNRFAKHIGKSDVWLSRLVNGKIEPTEEEKILISSSLGVQDVEALFVNQKKIAFQDQK